MADSNKAPEVSNGLDRAYYRILSLVAQSKKLSVERKKDYLSFGNDIEEDSLDYERFSVTKKENGSYSLEYYGLEGSAKKGFSREESEGLLKVLREEVRTKLENLENFTNDPDYEGLVLADVSTNSGEELYQAIEQLADYLKIKS